MFSIDIADRQNLLVIEPQPLREIGLLILGDAGYQAAEISVAVVDDEQIHQLNRQYLQHDYPTDVLSFVLDDDGETLNGEIVVSSETAVSNSREYDLAPTDELLLYVIHGLLHLVGYDDKSDETREEMRRQEAYYLKKCNVTRSATSSYRLASNRKSDS